MRADLLITGGIVAPVCGAPIRGGAVAVRAGRIVAVGRAEELSAISAARTIRLAPHQTVVPGLIDSHQHLLSYVRARTRLQLWDTASVSAVLGRIRESAERLPPGSWVVAVGHDQGRLAERRHPTLAELDAAAPEHPLLIYRACTHIALANSRALALAGLDAGTPDPAGGRIDRRDGALTGVLEESAMGLVSHVMSPPPIDWQAGLRDATREYHRRGITSIGEAALGHIDGLRDLEIVREGYAAGALGLRMYVMAYGALAEALLTEGGVEGLPPSTPPLTEDSEWLRFGCIKEFADGTLGGGTAWITEDYRDEPGNRGYPVLSAEELQARVDRAHRAGFQVAVHAIGDATVAMTLDAYEAALRSAPRAGHRHRIEHVEALHPGLPERFAELRVVAAVQSCFTYWEEGDVTRLGPALAPWGHAWGALQRAGVALANGSDNPVLPDFAPLQGIYASVARRNHAGLALGPQHALSVDEALHSYTAGAAFAAFEEREKGALAPGMLGDIAVISGDLWDADVERLRELVVDLTVCGGAVVHER